ncbi:unnamed protein product [Closterium sp. Naga37s-1]|nr:unnamed protein product [Closterium sp. Naga37s-1]
MVVDATASCARDGGEQRRDSGERWRAVESGGRGGSVQRHAIGPCPSFPFPHSFYPFPPVLPSFPLSQPTAPPCSHLSPCPHSSLFPHYRRCFSCSFPPSLNPSFSSLTSLPAFSFPLSYPIPFLVQAPTIHPSPGHPFPPSPVPPHSPHPTLPFPL